MTRTFERGGLTATNAPEALPAEQVIVLEIAGELGNFAKAVRRVPGLEFLAEEAEEKLGPDSDFAAVDRDGRRHSYTRQVFLVASDATAWQQLLGLWERYKRGDQFRRGLTPFRDLFARLREVRAWDDRDRLERTGASEVWAADFADLDDELVEFEAELWLRQDAGRREAAIQALRDDLSEVGGSLVQEFSFEEIDYHGVLARIPARHLVDAANRHQVRWLRTANVRFFHALGQVAAPGPGEEQATADALPPSAAPLPVGNARIALLDGLPFGGHEALQGRVVIDDPDGWEGTTTVQQRRHGTGMASLILFGDLNSSAAAATRPLYVRPILAPGPSWVRDAPEELPRDRLPVDVLHSAVTRLFEGESPAAPEVRVIVLAVGDRVEQFDRFVSPLARLLDWLSFTYGVLFIVSAGNHVGPVDIPADTGLEDPQELQHEILCHLHRTTGLRRILSPGESMNAVTVGAAHADAAPTHTDDRLEPMVTRQMPNVVTANGAGIRRSVKPDILLPGGRQLVRLEPGDGTDRRQLSVPIARRGPGVRMAAPGSRPGENDATVHATGTSVATALGGHHVSHLLDAIDSLRQEHPGRFPDHLDAVVAKAALVHTARWGSAATFIDQASMEVYGHRGRELVTRLIGYGLATPELALVSGDQRVTTVAASEIGDGLAHTYRLPLPLALAGSTTRRRLVLTLAWLSPINPEHRFYRRAALSLQPGGTTIVDERLDVDFNGTRRGTVQHNVLDGARAVPYAARAAIELTVTCRADAGELDVSVPYALLATLEVAQAIDLSIYAEVRQALQAQVLAPVPIPIRASE